MSNQEPGAWDGVGLPPVALQRMQRFEASDLKTSFLSVNGHVGVEYSGFSPLGEVLGTCVYHIGWYGFGGCGVGYGMPYGIGATVVSGGTSQSWVGFGDYVRALYAGWDSAIDRMRQEAQAMGADGVVGVRRSSQGLGNGNREFVVLGTAVRSQGTGHLKRPFMTELDGQDLAKLLAHGMIPVDMATGISIGIRHNDWEMSQQTSAFAPNTEVAGLSQLVTHVRSDCRSQLAKRAGATGAEDTIIHSMSLRVWDIEPSENHRDHVAEATITGTVLAHFQSGRPSHKTLTMLPLRRFRAGETS